MDALGEFPVRWDEAFSVWEAQMDLALLTEFTASDVHPPLYFWLLHLWLKVAGLSEFAIRALSVFAATLSLLPIYLITLRMTRRRYAAMIALGLAALSPFHIHWSQDARMYALATMFCSFTVYAYWSGRMRLFVFAGIGALLSHYFAALALGLIVMHRVVFLRAKPHRRRQFFYALAVIAAVFALWALYAFPLIRRDPNLASFNPEFAYKLMATLFTFGKATHIHEVLEPALLIVAACFIGLALAWRLVKARALAYIALGCLAPPLIITALALPFMPFHISHLAPRHFYIFSAFVFVGFGVAIYAFLEHRWLRVFGLAGCVALFALHWSLVEDRRAERYFVDDFRSMMATVAALTTQDDKVFFISSGRAPLVYYYLDRAGYAAPKSPRATPWNVRGLPQFVDDVPGMMEREFQSLTRFWLIEIEAHLDKPLNARIDWINQRYQRLYHVPIGWHNGISFYSKDSTDRPPEIEVVIPPPVREARPGDFVRIGLPAGVEAALTHQGRALETQSADTWMLLQFLIQPDYPAGAYSLQAAGERYPFSVTRAQSG